jgi:hypothetical protein
MFLTGLLPFWYFLVKSLMLSYKALMLFCLAASSASSVSLSTKAHLSFLALLFTSLLASVYALEAICFADLVLLLFNMLYCHLLAFYTLLFFSETMRNYLKVHLEGINKVYIFYDGWKFFCLFIMVRTCYFLMK